MGIICDTCAILMLIRIAPQLFIDKQYDCYTIHEARDELFKTPKFKERYPWRNNYKSNVECLTLSHVQKSKFKQYFGAIGLVLNNCAIDKQTGKVLDLSYTDKSIIAYALVCEYKISSGDDKLIRFAKQEFPDEFKGLISPLGVINLWLKEGIFVWRDEFDKYISDWKNEAPQPQNEIVRFEKLTKKKYLGL